MTYAISPASFDPLPTRPFLLGNLLARAVARTLHWTPLLTKNPGFTWPFVLHHNKEYRDWANLWSWVSGVRVPSLTPWVIDRTAGVVPTELLRWPFLSMAAGSDIGSGRCARRVDRMSAAGLQRSGGRGGAGVRLVVLAGGGAGCCGLSAVWKVVTEASAASACLLGGGGVGAGGQGPPGADFADVGGDQQQRGEQGAGGDAADAAAGWLGQGLVGGVFGVAVEAFDGVAQGGVAGVPGGGAVRQVLAVSGAYVGGDGDCGLSAEPGWCGPWR